MAQRRAKPRDIAGRPYVDLPLTEAEKVALAPWVMAEYAMLKFALQWWIDEPSVDADWRPAIGNTMVESFLIHARNMFDFFESNANGDDVVASHYVPEWTSDLADPIDIGFLRRFVPTINKRIAHITAYRVRRSLRDDMDTFKEVVDALDNIWNQFWRQLSPQQRSWFNRVLDVEEVVDPVGTRVVERAQDALAHQTEQTSMPQQSQPQMTGPDYLLAVAEEASRSGQPFAGDFRDMVFQAFVDLGTPGSSDASRAAKDYEIAPCAIVASAAHAAIEQRDFESLSEIINVGAQLIAKWPSYLMKRDGGHPDFVPKEPSRRIGASTASAERPS